MRNANELRQMIETEVKDAGMAVAAEQTKKFENSADILIDFLEKELKERAPEESFYKDSKQIIISFKSISKDFSKFDVEIKSAREDRFCIEYQLKEEPIYRDYYELEYHLDKARPKILSGLNIYEHKKDFIEFKNVLESRGFVCCTDISDAMFDTRGICMFCIGFNM